MLLKFHKALIKIAENKKSIVIDINNYRWKSHNELKQVLRHRTRSANDYRDFFWRRLNNLSDSLKPMNRTYGYGNESGISSSHSQYHGPNSPVCNKLTEFFELREQPDNMIGNSKPILCNKMLS